MSDIWQKLILGSGDLKLICLPGIGGRLWDVVFGGHSLLFQNPDLVNLVPDLDRLDQLPTRSPQFNFPLWGGEKTWIAPDSAWPQQGPHPVLDSGPYAIVERDSNRITMQSQICPHSKLRIERTIKLVGEAGFKIEHALTNCDDRSREAGIWSVMMLDRPASIALNVPKEQTPYSIVFGDPEGCVKVDGQQLAHECGRAVEFKTGSKNLDGEVLIACGAESRQIALICSSPKVRRAEKFAHGHNFEVFNSKDYDYCEAEWHSPCQSLEPGANIEFCQEFSLRFITASAVDNWVQAQSGK